jgi:hypothetical protein
LKLAALKKPIDKSLALKLGITLLLSLALLIAQAGAVLAAGATTSVWVASYAGDGKTVLAEKVVDYRWLEANLPVCGDGVTHYYHQGPVFEGDMWDPDETTNLKDKGAVRGTDIKELCDMVGGMAPGDEVVVCAADGYQVRFGYENVYQPLDRQGPIVLCWYKAEDAGTEYDYGYPGNDAYGSALQLVFMARTQNSEGKFVFGNTDMKICLPEEKYQHFYEGLPSTSGLSAKWVSEIRVYAGGAPDKIETGDLEPAAATNQRAIPWLPIALGGLGLILVAGAVYFFARRKG